MMMFLFKITVVTWMLSGFGSFSDPCTQTHSEITIENLSRKWTLEKYTVYLFTEAPSEVEANDYINLNQNLTFSSVSEGKPESGTWRLDASKKRIYLSEGESEAPLILIIDELTPNKLVLIVDDPTESDAQYLKIHFKD